MRVGRHIIDTDNMTTEELSTLINALKEIRARKAKKETYLGAITDLITDAQNEGFVLVDKDFGNIIRVEDLVIYDERGDK